jgi:hypothetical protein
MSSVSYWLKGCSNIVYAYCLYKLVERLSPTGSAYQDAHPICSIKMHHAAKNGLQRSMRIGYAKVMGGERMWKMDCIQLAYICSHKRLTPCVRERRFFFALSKRKHYTIDDHLVHIGHAFYKGHAN